MNETSNQLYIFLTFVLAGGGVGVLYSLLHFPLPKKRAKLGLVLQDVALSLLCCPALFLLNFYLCDGRVLLYVPFAVVVGIFFYCKTCKSVIDKGVRWLYNKLTKLISGVFK